MHVCKSMYMCIWGMRRNRTSKKGTVRVTLSETFETVRPILFSSKSFPIKQGDDYLTAKGRQGYYTSWGECRFMADGMVFFKTNNPTMAEFITWVQAPACVLWWDFTQICSGFSVIRGTLAQRVLGRRKRLSWTCLTTALLFQYSGYSAIRDVFTVKMVKMSFAKEEEVNSLTSH